VSANLPNSAASFLLPDPTALRCRRIFESTGCEVLRIESSVFPWRWLKAEAAKDDMIRRVARQYSSCLLWLADADAATAIGLSGVSAKLPGLVEIRCSAAPTTVAGLVEGRWGLFFFDKATLMHSLDALPVDPSDLCEAVCRMGARIAFVSWHDDSMRLVAVAR
jgi:hypothetical protein